MGRIIDTIIIHCSATRKNGRLTPFELERMHRNRGFNGCGYHYYIRKDGEICEMRPADRVGAHCKGHNNSSIGICYEGGLDNHGKPADTRTDDQKGSLIFLIKYLKKKYGITTIAGHRDFSPDLNGNGEIEPEEWIKACPCFDAGKEYGRLLE